MATSTLVVVAAVVTLIAVIIGGVAYLREQQNTARNFIDELDNKTYLAIDLNTEERDVYMRMSAALAEDPQRLSPDQLCAALLRRAMAVVPYIERIERDRPNLHKLCKNSYVPKSVLEEMDEAEMMLEMEIKEVQADAERLRPGWGQAIYAQAYDYVRKQRTTAAPSASHVVPGARRSASLPDPRKQPAQTPATSPPKPLASSAAANETAAAEQRRFTWTQTKEEVELTFSVPASTRPKDVTVKFSSQSCNVRIGPGEPALSGPLSHKVQADECTWSLVGDGDHRRLQVTLFKQDQTEWHKLLT